MTWFRPRSDRDFADEVESHIQLETDRLIDEGVDPGGAAAAARKAFGNPTRARERFHDASRWIWIEQLGQDLRYALRGFAKSRAFVVTSVLTLAVGLGLLTVAFTAFDAYFLRPLAVRGADRLYEIGWRGPDTGSQILGWRDFEELRTRTDLFDGVIAEDSRILTTDGRTLAASWVSDGYFAVLNPPMLHGRGLGPADAGQPAAVLGYAAWQRLFAGDPNVLGRELQLDERRVTIVGVTRPEFGGLDEYPKDMWLPAGPGGEQTPLRVLGRLRPGVTRSQAEAALGTFAARMAPAGKDARQYRAALEPNGTALPLTLDTVVILSPVYAAFALVLLTACANVSNALLARAIARQREIAVRLSLGASRSRIVRQLLTEGSLIALVAGAVALAFASWALRVGVVLLFDAAPPTLASLMRLPPMGFDARVFLFALAAAALATAMFALVPALRASRQQLTDVLHGQRTETAGGSRMRSALVVAQITVSMILVVLSLVLARNFARLAAVDVGYDTAGVYSINVRGDGIGLQRVAAALAAEPRIGGMAVTSGNPLFGRGRTVAAGPSGGRAPVPTRYTFVSPAYFDLLRLPLTRGRGFRDEEALGAAPVAIVSESSARAFWPGQDPIGKRVRLVRTEGGEDDGLLGLTEVTVVGTAPDVLSGLIADGRDGGHIYLPASPSSAQAIAMLIRPRASSDFRPDMLRSMFRELGYDPQRFEVISLDEMRDIQMFPVRAAAWIGGLLGATAIVLSIAGLYGVLTYLLNQRTREIGIRMALGATAGAVVRLMMRQCIRLAGVGAAIGLVLTAAALRWLASIITLRSVSLLDALPFAAATAVIAGAAALAAWQPARRAARVDPAETLRAEG